MAASSKRCDIEGVLNEEDASCITQHLPDRVTVEYEIHFDTELRLPYAFYWNGIKQPNGRVAITKKGTITTIRALVKQGDVVGIYLGSDASPTFRNELLYSIDIGSNDVKAVIKTKEGLNDDKAVLSPLKKNVPTTHGDKQDQYTGALTGDIWKRFSHCYTLAEATAILGQVGEIDSGIASAIQALYSGSVGKAAGLAIQFDGKHSCRIVFQAAADSNCAAHIKNGYGFGGQCLPRVHPAAWIALLQAARDGSIASLEISSSWRPMTGKSTHRIGLGLDIKSVRNTEGQIVVFDRSNTKFWKDDEERRAHEAWIDSENSLEKANLELKDASVAVKKGSGLGKAAAKERQLGAIENVASAKRDRDQAKHSFKKIHNGGLADSFEQSLLKNPLIKQMFNPVLMDVDTADQVEPDPNRLRIGNENTHRDHLHVTARDAYLLP